ncbi:lipase [Gilbertella persicaria]|uniref:lipase n=1 Tax=Gilbertella persicaria TaxID=101096 RepID=UPI00221FFC83|nr:lipase [Gilbertella persicaria]KAI8090275.1 lipase [Gilbertella persicaria]
MVSFTSISQSANILILASCLLIGSSHAAPVAGNSSANHTVSALDTLPPIISSRTQAVKVPSGNHDVESANIEKNKEWYAAHGGTYKFDKRDSSTIAGMTMSTPNDAPPVTLLAATSGITAATSAQVATFKKYAGIAATAYCDAVTSSKTWTCTQCKAFASDGKVITSFNVGADTVGFVMRSDADKTIYLAFRGSKTLSNWVTNLNFGLTNYTPVSGTKVHTGFYNAAKSAVSSYFSTIQGQLTSYPDYKVVVTGHSLGGALALLAGMDLYQRESRLNKSNLFIYTAGCPRVGNPAFAYYVQGTGITVSRSVNERDIVPHIPPASFDFLHPGVEAWTKSAGNVQICTSTVESDSCSNTIVPFTSIDDHLTYYGINEGGCK